MIARARSLASMVKLSHTVFAAPFAVAAAFLATRRPHAPIGALRVLSIAIALVAARTAAMTYNRIVDRDVDARNPRTATREIPAGIVSLGTAYALLAASSIAFLLAAGSLGLAPALLAVPVLLVLLGYSHAKRFTWASHLWLGVALALAPGGAWLAIGARPEPGIVALMVAVAAWVGGFDVLYSLQDEGFDRREGLSSVPARFGALGARRLSRALHLVTVVALAASWRMLAGGPYFLAAVVLVGVLLVYEHALVRRDSRDTTRLDLTRLGKAFFDVNGWISLAFLALVALDVLART